MSEAVNETSGDITPSATQPPAPRDILPSATQPQAPGDIPSSVTQPQAPGDLALSVKERIRQNKEKALSIRRARLAACPYEVRQKLPPDGASKLTQRRDGETSASSSASTSASLLVSSSSSLRDTGGGYLLEEEEEERERQGRGRQVAEEKAPTLYDEQMLCEECGKLFAESYLFNKFDLCVCDKCRDPNGKHSLITKTEAKQKYLLKDCDFGERDGPTLSCILKRNPHSNGWGDMHLYLLSQVEARSHLVWGGVEGLEIERERRREAREKKKEKKYAKEIKDLRKAIRSSLSQSIARTHQHSYGEEVYCAESDLWTRTCSQCEHQLSYEKM